MEIINAKTIEFKRTISIYKASDADKRKPADDGKYWQWRWQKQGGQTNKNRSVGRKTEIKINGIWRIGE